MKLSWKVLVAFTGIFITGVVTGVFVGPLLIHRFAPKPVMTDQLKKFTEQLDLTPVQRDKIRPILKQTADDLRKARREAFTATTAILERMETAISKELTDAQRIRFTEMQAQERERRKQWIPDRSKQRGENRPPSPDGPPNGTPPAPGAEPAGPASAPPPPPTS